MEPESAGTGPSQCWCCGAVEDSARMVRLGNHPEVGLCLRCARWTSKRARELEDTGRVGPGVLMRDSLRVARRTVMDRGWHHYPLIGGPLRWLGKRLP